MSLIGFLRSGLVLGFAALLPLGAGAQTRDLSLDGRWEMGIARQYWATAEVPGLAQDATKVSPGRLWYRRTVELPGGEWKVATLTLKGARFDPEVYVDGEKAGAKEGGMAPISLPLRSRGMKPGHRVVLEIALRSLSQVPDTDASSVPGADRWRTNVSSGLWDDMTLHFAGSQRITRIVPWTDFARRRLAVHWAAEGMWGSAGSPTVKVEILDGVGAVLARGSGDGRGGSGVVEVPLGGGVIAWSPQHPRVYQMRLSLIDRGRVEDVREASWGLKEFESRDRRFYLNGEPVEMLGGTVVWHRFLRQPGAAEVAFDTGWFKANITDRLKSYGANTLRWHLGLPPERLLDLCDREGLMVQLEWPFFHGIPASVASMEEHWTAWLDVAMRHPSVMLVHPWNETGDAKALANGWKALNAILPQYPPLVVAHRDTVHIHKYWWSLFENLGLYYDRADQFETTAMVDEFGGNYLDWNGDPGRYPSTKESFLRFLGREETEADRLEFHAKSNARIAEYWRRVGVAGILPFCILGSLEDGSSWFLGNLHDPRPMPVWDALAAAWSPVSVSLDVWDRNYTPGQTVTLPVYLFNDSSARARLTVEVRVVESASGKVVSRVGLSEAVGAHERGRKEVAVTMPDRVGDFRFEAVLLNPPAAVHHRVASWWDVRTVAPKAPVALAGKRIAVADREPELAAMLRRNGITALAANDKTAEVIVGSAATWKRIAGSDAVRGSLGDAVRRGVSVVLLDVGPRDLGEGYRTVRLGSLQGAPVLRNAYSESAMLFEGVKVTFHQQAEPESHIQPALGEKSLWAGLPLGATRIWNGLRGGLIAPAADMEVSGLGQEALRAQWKERGADAQALSSGGSYFAYELAGYYAFSTQGEDKAAQDALRARVRFLVEDAPALKDVIDPNSPIEQIDLARVYRGAAGTHAQKLVALSLCGKGLTRAEIVEVTFGAGEGKLLLSQALTAGRLGWAKQTEDFWGVRYDPAAEQFTLNMIAHALTGNEARQDDKGEYSIDPSEM